MSDNALIAWQQKFGASQLELGRDDPAPFSAGRRLGGGGVGIVHETALNGIPLALKRTYTRRLSKQHLNEIKILCQTSGKQHRHIVELIGSYVQQQRGGYEIGLLIFPIAHCDLSTFLCELDALLYWNSVGSLHRHASRDETAIAVDTLSAFHPRQSNLGRDGKETFAMSLVERKAHINTLIESSQQRLCSSFACIAEAVAYLHRQNIRHKDIKPSQILLSPDGLWLTDFGWSIDTTALSNSATSNIQCTTYRYQAPERAAHGPCGRTEDIFALGCTFLEMCVRLLSRSDELVGAWKSPMGESWSFQANLDKLKTWTFPFDQSRDPIVVWVSRLIQQMMAYKRTKRPTIDEVIERLSYDVLAGRIIGSPYKGFVGTCCVSENQPRDVSASDGSPQAVSADNAQAANSVRAQIRKFRGGAKKRHNIYVWRCCHCGTASISISHPNCQSCGYPRCAYCDVRRESR